MISKLLKTVAVLLAFASVVAGQEAKSFLSVQEILSGWQNNYGSLKSMKVSYCQHVVSAEAPQKDPNITKQLVNWNYVESNR